MIIPKNQSLDFSKNHGWPLVWGYTEVADEFVGIPTDPSVRYNRWMTHTELMAQSFKKREIRLEAKPALEAFRQMMENEGALK